MPVSILNPRGRPVAVLESLYRLEPDDETWARAVLADVEHLIGQSGSTGLVALTHDDDLVPAHQPLSVTTAAPEVDALNQLSFFSTSFGADLPQMFRVCFYPGAPVTSHSRIESTLTGRLLDHFRAMRALVPCVDTLGLYAYPAPGFVVTLWAFSDRSVDPEAPGLRVLHRLVAHLDTAARLRAQPELAVAAVASPEGTLVDIEDSRAKPAGARARLSAHVAAVERARLHDRRRDLDAIEDWKALVAGRYSVVPREDVDGKRYYLLVVNAPYAERHARLAQREIDVVRLAARGFTNKAAAYALGLSASATSGALASAAAKVGLASRFDLVAVARAIFGGAGGESGMGLDESRLTFAEREVFLLLRRGMSNADIARMRRRSVHTVANQVSAILAKSGAPSRRTLSSERPAHE